MAEINLFKHSRDTVSLEVGDSLFAEGDPGDCMYAVLEGHVQLMVRGVGVEEVGPGGIIGELALIDRAPRSADARALTRALVARVDHEQFSYLVHEHPTFALEVMTVMADRLRHANTHT